MSEIYVFGANEEQNDYSTMGLVGALTPTKCVFNETANGESIVTLEHPLDSFGRYTALERNNILVVPVPVRTTPEIQNGETVTTVWTYRVKDEDTMTSVNQRGLFKNPTGDARISLMSKGDIITVVSKPTRKDTDDYEPRWKAKTRYGTGYIESGDNEFSAIELVTEHVLPQNNSEAISEETTNWKVVNQLFRIYEVQKNLDSVSVSARHISYDLLYNMISVDEADTYSLPSALAYIKEHLLNETTFDFKTNVTNERAGLKYELRNPIDVFLNEEDGICTRYDVGLVRDNYSLFFLHDPGVNRGIRIQYSKNMTGIEYTESDDEIVTRILPVGEYQDGTPLYLTNMQTPISVDWDGNLSLNDYGKTVKRLKAALNRLGYTVSSTNVIDSNTVSKLRAFQRNAGIDESGVWDQPTYIKMVSEINKIGKWADGSPFVDSEYINSYPIIHTKELKCDNCKVGDSDGNGFEVSVNVARARMRDQAESLFGKDIDKPKVTIAVEFVNLGDTEEYSQYKGLENCFLFDYVLVQNSRIGVDVTAQITEIEWDVLTEKMNSVTVGTPGKTLANTGITSWQIPSGFSGSKIAHGTVGSGALMDSIINARHIQSETINADKISAGAITAEKIATGALDTIMISALLGKFNSITAGTINTDAFAAELARIAVLNAGTATFDRATVQHLVSNAMNLEYGVAGQLFIRELAIEYAQIVDAAIGNLVIKAKDGNYYHIDVNSDGTVTANLTTVTNGEIEAGQTNSGKVILETNIVASNLSTSNLLATYALVNKIDAARIDVDTLISRQIFADELYTSNIFGGKSLQLIAGEASAAMALADGKIMTFAQNDAPSEAESSLGDMWIDTNDGNKLYRYDGTAWIAYQDSGIGAASAAASAAQRIADGVSEDFQRVVRIDIEGLHVGDNRSAAETLIDSDSVNVVINGQKYSKFASNYVQFGDYQLRRSSDGGLVFKKTEV